MNDEFLTQFLEAPRPEFAEALYERISRQSQPRFSGAIATKLTFRNAVVAFLFILLVAACVYAVTEIRWNKVSGIWVDVQRTIKVENPLLSGESIVAEEEDAFKCYSIDEAREMLRFRFKVPTWVPDGFTFSDELCGIDDLTPSYSFPFLKWEGTDKNTLIVLYLRNLEWFNMATQKYEVGPASTSMFGMPVAPDSYEEVQVHGQPAVLVCGDWNWEDAPWATGETSVREYEYTWDMKRALQLYWVDGDVFYHLYTRAKVSPEDLIKMAESAQ